MKNKINPSQETKPIHLKACTFEDSTGVYFVKLFYFCYSAVKLSQGFNLVNLVFTDHKSFDI